MRISRSIHVTANGIICSFCRWVIFYCRASLVAQRLKRLPLMWETQVRFLGREDPLEKETVTHSSILAWRIPWTEKPGRLQSTGSQRVRHDWATSLTHSIFYCIYVPHFLYSLFCWWTHLGCFWKVVVESREYTGILGPRRRRIQSGARDEAWSLRAFV